MNKVTLSMMAGQGVVGGLPGVHKQITFHWPEWSTAMISAVKALSVDRIHNAPLRSTGACMLPTRMVNHNDESIVTSPICYKAL